MSRSLRRHKEDCSFKSLRSKVNRQERRTTRLRLRHAQEPVSRGVYKRIYNWASEI